MSPRLLRLEGASLEELREQVRSQHGPRAQIVGAELVTVGGIRGYFARRHYEVTVELPDPTPEPELLRRRGRRAAAVPSDSVASGIDALVEHAESIEAEFHPGAPVSTGSDLFAALMDDLTFNTTPPPAVVAAKPVPPLPSRPGDLAVVVDLGGDALSVARSMADSLGAPSRAVQMHDDGGATGSSARFAVAELRATGVRGGFPVFLAVQRPLSGFNDSVLVGFEADQVWLVVDAGRKPVDTATWVSDVRAGVDVHGIAVVGLTQTATPATVNQLGLPIGWLDGARATSPVL